MVQLALVVLVDDDLDLVDKSILYLHYRRKELQQGPQQAQALHFLVCPLV